MAGRRSAARMQLVEVDESPAPEPRRDHPDHPEVLARLGQCRFQQGRDAEARRLLEAAVEKLPDDPLVLIHLAKMDLQDGRVERAERWARHLLRLDAADYEGQYTLARILRRQG